MGETPASGAGCPVTDEMIDGWERALGRDEWPSGWVNVGEIVEGKLPDCNDCRVLADGGTITDEDIERECAEYESGTWEGHLANLRVSERERSILSDIGDYRAGRLETYSVDEVRAHCGLDD